jgi:putative RNA 2'-phosphotransferase
MGKQKAPEQFAKFLSYILERKPDEFGLVLDPDGYVKIKELLKAISEEEGWKHIRRANIEEVLISVPNSPIEIDETRIRAKKRENLPKIAVAIAPPKLLYTCVRKKAHAFVLDKGIFPQGYPKIILSSSPELAERIGKRADTEAILLTVQTQKAGDKGLIFQQAGESLFLADFIPPDCFTGPPLPKEKAESKKQDLPEAQNVKKTPGSFFIDLKDLTDEDAHKKQTVWERKKRGIIKEKDKRRQRKQKQKMWPES